MKGFWEQAFAKTKKKLEGAETYAEQFAAKANQEVESGESPVPNEHPQPPTSTPQGEATVAEGAGGASPRASNPGAQRGHLFTYPIVSHNAVTSTYPSGLKKMRSFLDNIWVNLLLETGHQPKTILFCGATRSVGTTFVAFHFSMFLALEHKMKVLYADTGVESAGQPSALTDLQQRPGLASFLMGQQPLPSLIAQSQYENLFVLPFGAGQVQGKPHTISYRQDTLSELMDHCRAHFDLAIFDSQPVVEYPSTVGFARAVDQVVFVCRYGQSRREVEQLAIDKLRQNGASVGGVVLNDRHYPIPPGIYKTLK